MAHDDTRSGEGAGAVEVVYALPEEQFVVRVDLAPGMTVLDAVERSGLPERHPEIDRRALVLGVFGERVAPDAPARAGQRIEICRPLEVDPREARRAAAAHGSVIGARDGGGRR